MNIIQAIEDRHLLGPYYGDLSTRANWLTLLRVLEGLPVESPEARDLVRTCTGRDPDKLPADGFSKALLLIGRRSGKSQTAALIAAHAAISGQHKPLAIGEIPVVAVVAPTRFQGRIIYKYILAALSSTRLLQNEIVAETGEGFRLKSGVEIHICTGDYRSIRGHSLIAAIVDEVCFFHLAEDAKVKSDLELIAAIKPALATTGGRLICVGSPYAKKGWAYLTVRTHFGSDKSGTLVWRAPSRTMNPTLPEQVVNDALAEDPAAARAEYLGEFRDDIAAFVTRDTVEACVIPGRTELPYHAGTKYSAFIDVSGGRSDAAALAIGHKAGSIIDRIVVIDKLRHFPAPHNPYQVVAEMVSTLREYQINRATADAYSAEWAKQAFSSHGIQLENASQSQWNSGAQVRQKVAKPRNVLYAELLPRLTSGGIELPDNELLISQLCALERRTRSGGRDTIDHPPGGHDDLSNVVAGVADALQNRQVVLGSLQPPPLYDGIAGARGEPKPPWARNCDRIMRQHQALLEHERWLFSQPDHYNEPIRQLMRRVGRA
jgi:hypothetical protein